MQCQQGSIPLHRK